jgi:MFS family permease
VTNLGALGAWAAAMVLSALQTTLQSFPSAFEPELREAFALNATGFALLASSFQATYIPAQLAAGVLLDRFRVERLLLVSAVAGAVLAAGGALAPTGWTAAGLRAAAGLVGSIAFPGSLAIAARRFSPRAFAAIATASEGFGLTGAAMAQALLPGLAAGDWRTASAIVAAAILASAVPIALIPRAPCDGAPAAAPTDFGAVLRKPQIWLVASAGGLLAAVPFGFGAAWAPNLVAGRFGFDAVESARASSWIFMGVAVGAPLLGVVAATGRRRDAALLGAPPVVAALLGWIVYGPAGDVLSLSLQFFALGLAASAYSLVFARVAEIAPPPAIATAMGLANLLVMAIGACVLAPLYGSLLDWLADGATTVGAYPDPQPETVVALQRAMGLFLAAPLGACALFSAELLLRRRLPRAQSV